MLYYIYCFTNRTNGMQYIGQVMQHNERDRYSSHKRNNNGTYFDKAFSKHPDDFDYKIITTAPSQETADELEKMYIRIWNTKYPNGYNLADGGKIGWHHNEESKAKMRAACIGKNAGENNPMYGKHFSEESKAKMRAAKIGKPLSEEHKTKLSEAHKGINSKKFMCVSLDGTFTKTFGSGGEAERWLKENGHPKASQSAISKCCCGKLKTAYGFHWKYI